MMKKVIIATATLMFSFVFSYAGEIDSNFRWQNEVRSITIDELLEWSNHPTASTSCASGSCCIDGNAACTASGAPFFCCTGSGTGTCISENDSCIGVATPVACCTGSGTGTCHLQACIDFSFKVRSNFSYWSQFIEEVYQDDGDWACQTREVSPNKLETVCSTVNSTPMGDIRGYVSFLAFANEQVVD